MAAVAGETSPAGRYSQRDPDRDGSHLPRRGRISLRNSNSEAIGCVCCIQGKRISFTANKACAESTDQLDAMTIARVLLSGEARAGYIPSDLVATYRELVRLHTQLSEEAARYQNEIQALVVVLFPEFTQVFADPCLPSALSVRHPPFLMPRRSSRQVSKQFTRCYGLSSRRVMVAPPPRSS